MPRPKHESPIKITFQASCPCGWVGRAWSYEARAKEDNQNHECEIAS